MEKRCFIGVSGVAQSNGGSGTSADYLLAKLYGHFQIGGGDPFDLDATTLDFSGTNQGELGIADLNVGDKRLVNLFDAGINSNSLAFGRIWVTSVCPKTTKKAFLVSMGR